MYVLGQEKNKIIFFPDTPFLCLFVLFVFLLFYYFFFFFFPRIMVQDSWGHYDMPSCTLFVLPVFIRYVFYEKYIPMYL